MCNEGGDLQVVSILEGKQEEFDVLSRESVVFDSFVGFCEPEVFLHDKVFMNFVADDVVDCLLIVVLFLEGEQFEPVD